MKSLLPILDSDLVTQLGLLSCPLLEIRLTNMMTMVPAQTRVFLREKCVINAQPQQRAGG